MFQDIRTGFRSLLRAPILAITIIVTVGIGIGATTAIFAAIDAAMLQPLPYTQPDQLVRIYTDAPPFRWRFSAADYLTFRDQQRSFADSATYTDRSMIYSDGVSSDLMRVRVVSRAFFSVLGITLAAGTDFTDADAKPGAPLTVIASHAFWQQRLGGRPDAIGKPIKLDGANYIVIGALPPRLGPLERRSDLFLIQQFQPPQRKGPFLFTVVARLPQGANRAAASDELRAINKRMFPTWQASYQDDKATWSMESLKTAVVGNVDTIAALSLVSVGLVWLIACANASSLLIARVTSRRRELAVRSALGASRARVVRYLLGESVVLALGAVALGGVLAWGGIQLLHTLGAQYFPRLVEADLDGRALWLLAGLAASSALIFGLIPAVQITRGTPDASLRAIGRTATGSPALRRLRRLVVAGQFAIATPLLVVAVLLVSSLWNLRDVDLGFDQQNVLTASIRLPAAQYRDDGRVRVFWSELSRRIAASSVVSGVAFADGLPPNGVGNINNFDLEEHPALPGKSQPTTPWVDTTPEYSKVLGLELLEGRLLTVEDSRTQNLESVVVDRAWAQRFFPGQSALGKRFRGGGCTTCPWTSVVGVVSSVKYMGLDHPDDGTVYTPMSETNLGRSMVVRTRADAGSFVPEAQRILRELDPSVPLSNIATMDDLVTQSLQRPQSLSMLVLAFALVALTLSVVGIYGVMGNYVQEHLKDIGIRLALGGSAGDVLKLVLGQGLRLAIAGVLAGVLGAVGLARLVSSLLFGVSPIDVPTFAMVSVGLVAVAFVACLLPARRAVRVHPAVVLRAE